ncbi:uncharacterized protein I206_101982 [Kwoniella pini CBS 10737]|uniref:ATP-dependent RNA helicase n=1 Tax=Kwoniella pini CBS 10737 TaxID=1296096 RepID=A0A1B9HV65_9TREE|nr:ATP-dependent RNA helicase DBP7 [Kwoniella pini CBS 10737]OCF47148.1 ATP-dependent RNA helicase DBP7 [Kwoniella pini CBS 10737]
MADDGIELNFAVPPSGVAVRQVAAKKGGRWTDRVKAKRDARDSYKNLKQNSTSLPPPTPAPAASKTTSQPPLSSFVAPVDRPKPSQGPQPRSVSLSSNAEAGPSRLQPFQRSTTTSAPKARSSLPHQSARPTASSRPEAGPSRPTAASTSSAPQPKTAQFISSLFSADPLPKASAPSTPVQPLGAPSNAPLVSDTSTFEGLGMDPLLVRHLKTKMHVENPTGIQRSCLPYMLSSPLDPDQTEDTSAPLRDVLIQAQTGSGKTLSYLLPIVQTLLPLSKLSYIDRSIGTLAIILAPTRELAQQISKVVEQLISMSLSLDEEDDRQFTRWLVSGLLTGGTTRTHEKARLRKGVPILVSTPGRLLDHLQNTSSFQCAKTMFLVLDEADRLMDLGFEETIKGILKALEGRRKNEINVEKELDEEGGGSMRWGFWGRGRTNILCSATVDAKVEKLSGMALRDPILFRAEKEITESQDKDKDKGDEVKNAIEEAGAIVIPKESEDKFTPPSQLSQKYVVTPTKLRLVALVALLRSLIASATKIDTEKGTKIIVFLSSTDSVDFHWKLLGGVQMGETPDGQEDDEEEDENGIESADDESGSTSKVKKTKTKKAKKTSESEMITLTSPLFPNTTLHRLHGSLPLRTRMASLKSFATQSSQPSVLFATSVASRGLDLPLVRAVIQYDLPTEGGANEYVHRVGRTARAGKGGEAWAFIAQNEIEWVPWVENKMGNAEGSKSGVKLSQVGVEDVLRKGFGGKGWEFEGRATEVQLGFERWVLDGEQNAALARRAFSSFIRAYSTHPLEEKKFFHIKSIHLGHLAKSFALREAPGQLTNTTNSLSSSNNKTRVTSSATAPANKKRKHIEGDSDNDENEKLTGGKELTARNETERRMYEAVRKQGRMIKSGGKLGEFNGTNKRRQSNLGSSGGAGGGEFQVYGTSELERMVSGKR